MTKREFLKLKKEYINAIVEYTVDFYCECDWEDNKYCYDILSVVYEIEYNILSDNEKWFGIELVDEDYENILSRVNSALDYWGVEIHSPSLAR